MARHHFVPQFYLKGFVDPSSTRTRNPYLWVVDLQKRTVKRRAPKNVAKIAGYYDWEELGDGVPSVEILFSQLESMVAPLFSRLRSNDFRITLEDRLNLSLFLGIQVARTPFSRKIIENGIRSHAYAWVSELIDDEDRFRALLEKSRVGIASGLTPESIRRDLFEEKTLRLVPRPDSVLAGTLDIALRLSQVILVEAYWMFLLAQGGSSFLTSDHPVSVGKAKQTEIGGIRTPELEIAFPISPSCFLWVRKNELCGAVEGVDSFEIESLEADKVKQFNQKMLNIVDRYVFCASKQQGKWVLAQ